MKKAHLYRIYLLTMFSFIMVSCQKEVIVDKAVPIKNFDVNRYLGTWYEIARFDFSFEKDLDNTTAHYTLNDNGDLKVLNSGFNTKSKQWKKADGTAKFRKDKTVGLLKVSFFGPFYSSYNIIALDPEYKYALVVGKDYDYLWILSRETTIPEHVKKEYLELATQIGYDISKLLWIDHNRNDNPYLN